MGFRTSLSPAILLAAALFGPCGGRASGQSTATPGADTGVSLRPAGEVRRFAHKGGVFDVAWSRDGRRALSAGNDQQIHLWDVETARELQTMPGHTSPIREVAFTQEDRVAISASFDRTIRLWDLEHGRELRKYEGHGGATNCLAVSADGRLILSGGLDELLL